MKKFFRFVFLTLVLLVVALFSALTTMRYAIHGREVAVPDLVGKSPAEARRMTENDGFGFTIERQYYSGTVAAGKILSQVPAAGTQVRRGWEIRVAQSLGPQRVQIPNVQGESERVAEMNIERRGLNVSAVADVPWPADASDQVIAQSPSPDASSISDPKISLLIAAQPQPQTLLMPSFLGQPLGRVSATVQDAGLRVGSVTLIGADGAVPMQGNPTANSTIASQTPAAGERVMAGVVVNFQVH